MDSYRLEESLTWSEGLADPFMDVEYDPQTQTGSDWYSLMLAASLGGMPVHGATNIATCETLAKTTEVFAKKHAIGRIHYNDKCKDTDHASDEWFNKNLTGKAFHGAKTSNKARMLFDTGEWEPSQRTRAKNAAFVGALLATSGNTLEDSVKVASAVSGEQIPIDAITRTELPMQILKREAASSAKPNHIVYAHANAQKAISWDDAQLHQEILPPTAAMDWSRITTIARYIGEANCMVDTDFIAYSRAIGVPYALINGAWAHVSAADYMLDPSNFDKVPVDAAEILPSSRLSEAYEGHAEGMYDAIHRMSNEIAAGLVDPTLEALVKAAENARKRSGKTKLATGTWVLSEPSKHKYGAEESAESTRTSARSWDAFVKALSELVLSNRVLNRAAAETVVASREKRDYYPLIEPILCEVCMSALWVRTNGYLSDLLHNSQLATDRVGKLRRGMLNNSAPINVNVTLTNRIRVSATPQVLSALRLIIAGKIPELRIPVDARFGIDIKSMNAQKTFISALNKHLAEAKKEWTERYNKLSNAYGLAGGRDDLRNAVLFGCAAKAFKHINGYLLTQLENRFIDPDVLDSSYLVEITKSYVRKRHITMPSLNALLHKPANLQALELDNILQPDVPFTEVESFIYDKLHMFYSDIAEGRAPSDDNAFSSPLPTSTTEAFDEDDLALLEGMMAELDATPLMNIGPQEVLNSYNSEDQANRHARLNGFADFFSAYEELGQGARYDKESNYTIVALKAEFAAANEEEASMAGDMPVI